MRKRRSKVRTRGGRHWGLASHKVRVKIRYTRRKGKSPEAKGSLDKLRKAGKKQAKLRRGNYK